MDVPTRAAASAELRLALAQEVAGIGLWEWDPASGAVDLDERCVGILGRDAADVASFDLHVHPEDRDVLDERRAASVAAGTPLEVEYRIVRPDGEVRVVFVRGQGVVVEGRLVRYLGAMLDVTEARAASAAEAEHSRRLSRLAAVSLELAGASTVRDLVEVVIDRGLVVLGADGGSVCVRDDERGVLRLYATESLPDRVHVEFAELPLDGPLPGSYVARTGETVLLPDRASGLAFSPAMQVVYDGTGRDAWAVVPLAVDQRLLGSLVVAWTEEHVLDDADLTLLRGFAAQCAQSLDRVLHLQEQTAAALAAQRLSEALQRGLLTRPPQPDDLDIGVRYLPASQEAQVGGDWYDAFVSEGDSTVVVVGDVNGHDRDAAATMGQVRNLLRGLTVDSDLPPAALLRRLDAALRRLELDTLATAVLARVQPGRPARVEWSNAGHLPPLVLRRDGTVDVLEGEADLLLGLGVDVDRQDAVAHLAEGDTLFLYTDGLVERRGEDLDVGIARLRGVLAGLAGCGVEEVCDAVVAALLPDGGEDDVALLALQPQHSPVAATAPPLPGGAADVLVLPPEPQSVGRARRHVRAACDAAGVTGDARDTALLLTSELVTNALLHGRSQAKVTARTDGDRLRVEVADDNSRLPELAREDRDALDGRGLAILDMLADAWGAEPQPVGKVVWFELVADA